MKNKILKFCLIIKVCVLTSMKLWTLPKLCGQFYRISPWLLADRCVKNALIRARKYLEELATGRLHL